MTTLLVLTLIALVVALLDARSLRLDYEAADDSASDWRHKAQVAACDLEAAERRADEAERSLQWYKDNGERIEQNVSGAVHHAVKIADDLEILLKRERRKHAATKGKLTKLRNRMAA